MRTQQQADREEQQRIKNLVLNYEMSTENETNDGKIGYITFGEIPKGIHSDEHTGLEKRSTPHRDTKVDKSNANRSGFRGRKLQLSDVDW